MIRYSYDRSIIVGRPPAAESGDLFRIDLEFIQGGLDLFLGEGGGDFGS